MSPTLLLSAGPGLSRLEVGVYWRYLVGSTGAESFRTSK